MTLHKEAPMYECFLGAEEAPPPISFFIHKYVVTEVVLRSVTSLTVLNRSLDLFGIIFFFSSRIFVYLLKGNSHLHSRVG